MLWPPAAAPRQLRQPSVRLLKLIFLKIKWILISILIFITIRIAVTFRLTMEIHDLTILLVHLAPGPVTSHYQSTSHAPLLQKGIVRSIAIPNWPIAGGRTQMICMARLKYFVTSTNCVRDGCVDPQSQSRDTSEQPPEFRVHIENQIRGGIPPHTWWGPWGHIDKELEHANGWGHQCQAESVMSFPIDRPYLWNRWRSLTLSCFQRGPLIIISKAINVK